MENSGAGATAFCDGPVVNSGASRYQDRRMLRAAFLPAPMLIWVQYFALKRLLLSLVDTLPVWRTLPASVRLSR